MSVQLPGHPTDICILKHLAGLLVSCTHHNGENLYRENLFHLNMKGEITGCLPMLGPGPRSFFPCLLPDNPDVTAASPEHGRGGYYVYMRDGHEGIIAVYIEK
ncbi:uncharacterized protein LOC101849571 [Aplysia californica]|uniref:Uncharacterized protein LOC101849571 n=1 Tax=Aplysia californica TaxID=6500 RepID=A0ABM0K8K5_APLCA|nr:uncharacterized protein LOC101849571 [Aplysia californica]